MARDGQRKENAGGGSIPAMGKHGSVLFEPGGDRDSDKREL